MAHVVLEPLGCVTDLWVGFVPNVAHVMEDRVYIIMLYNSIIYK